MSDVLDWFRQRGVLCVQAPGISNWFEYEAPVRLMGPASFYESAMGAYSYLAQDSHLVRTRMGRYCSVGNDCRIGLSIHPQGRLTTSPITYRNVFGIDGVSDPDISETKDIDIGHDVWIGTRAIVMGGVTIGNGAIIGAGAVVTRDVAPHAVVGGNPARVIKMRFSERVSSRIQNSSWWDYDLIPANRQNLIDWSDAERTLDRLDQLKERRQIAPFPGARFRITRKAGALTYSQVAPAPAKP
jgi:acetyltransferase-like isoleucine patch superfamily enzyme